MGEVALRGLVILGGHHLLRVLLPICERQDKRLSCKGIAHRPGVIRGLPLPLPLPLPTPDDHDITAFDAPYL